MKKILFSIYSQNNESHIVALVFYYNNALYKSRYLRNTNWRLSIFERIAGKLLIKFFLCLLFLHINNNNNSKKYNKNYI